jgi:hypothetical protein
VSVAITPANGNLLTCSSVSATVTGATDTSVAWSTNPAGIGGADTKGNYAAPIKTPSPAAITLTATSNADKSASASGMFTLGTAFPHPAVTVTGSTSDGESFGVFPHWTAAKGMRVYNVWPQQTGTSVKLMLSRSDDSGGTFATAKPAISATVTDSNTHIDCAAVAIDAGNADVVYALAMIDGSNDLATGVGADGAVLALATSTDGGGTFTTRVLQVGGTAGGPSGLDLVGICGDVVSTSANTVVVASPGVYNADSAPDIAIFTDNAQGAGFASGTLSNNDYVAGGYQASLSNVNGAATPQTRVAVQQDGESADGDGATESPRLFTDGAGNLCITYIGFIEGPPSSTHTYVECSTDAGKNFTGFVALDPADADLTHSQSVGAIGAGGRAAVVWTTGIAAGGKLMLATRPDAMSAFGTPVAIPTYVVPGTMAGATVSNPALAYDANGVLWVAYAPSDGGLRNRIVVDKSCDDGKTWSGAVLVNGPEASIVDMRWPSFAMTAGATPHVFAMAADHGAIFSLAP